MLDEQMRFLLCTPFNECITQLLLRERFLKREKGSFIIHSFQNVVEDRWYAPWMGSQVSPFLGNDLRIWINFSSNAFFFFFTRKYICSLEAVSYQNEFSHVLTLRDKDYIANKYILAFKISTDYIANPEQAFSLYFFFNILKVQNFSEPGV